MEGLIGKNINFWIIIGFLGQVMFFLRFFVQWLHSEKHKKSLFPFSFWYFSIAGGVILFIYAIHIKDIVFSLGQGLGLLIYIRNIMLSKGNNEANKKV
ncbi:MAG: lipid-A-disaccharide synthase N-terminal domain-containing protein [Patescibacteria group bacterium]|jgi:lipid-A-disaccharide synthase-like uncharacterized protein